VDSRAALVVRGSAGEALAGALAELAG
jgi:hypothetical protein